MNTNYPPTPPITQKDFKKMDEEIIKNDVPEEIAAVVKPALNSFRPRVLGQKKYRKAPKTFPKKKRK